MSVSATQKTEPSSIDELLEFIVATVKSHYGRTGRGLDGSLLSHLVRQQFPELNYAKLGLTRLGDVVRAAMHRGLVARRTDVTHLVLLPIPQATQGITNPNPENHSAHKLTYVRQDIWRAVVIPEPGVVSFLHRTTGELIRIQIAELTRLKQARADENLLEVPRATHEQQLAWLRDFLAAQQEPLILKDADLGELLRSGLKSLGSAISREWIQLRSRRVVEEVRSWAGRNGTNEELVLTPPKRIEKSFRSALPQRGHGGEEMVRQRILAAIGEMSDEELESCVRLPLRLVMRHFAPK